MYWRCTPTVCDALLHVPGLVDHQHRTRVAEGVDDVIAQIIADRIGVPFRPGQQVLQPVRSGSPRCSAIVQQFLRSSPETIPSINSAACRKRLVPGKPRRDPVDHRRELRPPPIRVYAMSRGDRGVFSCLHKLRTMPRSPPLPAQTRQNHQSRTTAAVLGQRPEWVPQRWSRC